MVKLSKKLLSLALIIALFCLGVICLAPYSSDYAYSYRPISASEDGDKLGWVRQRMLKPIDYAFVGSSHTLRGIDDGFIEAALRKAGGDPAIEVSNLGRNWLGRNLDYLTIKELLERQRPRVIFLEVTEKLPLGGHVLFPILAKRADLFDLDNLSNLRLASDLQTAFKSRFDSLVASLCQNGIPQERRFAYKEYGYMAVDGALDGRTAAAAESDGKGMVEKHLPLVYRTLCGINYSFERNYLDKIRKLAREKGVKIAFIYLPDYGNPKLPEEYQEKTGQHEFLMPPASILGRAENFADIGHLNRKGSRELSSWIAGQIIADRKRSPGESGPGTSPGRRH